jgi:hypothetical protein
MWTLQCLYPSCRLALCPRVWHFPRNTGFLAGSYTVRTRFLHSDVKGSCRMTGKAAKPFTERLRDRAASSKGRPGLANRAAILAAREDIQAALADRWPVRQIWEQLVEEERIACGYVWFAKHVRDLISSPARSIAAPVEPVTSSDVSAAPAAPPVEPALPADPPPSETPEPRPRPKRFHHPESPDMKDYL